MILSIDPGKDKTGIAIYDPAQKMVLDYQIVPTSEFTARLILWEQEYSLQMILLGDGTLSKEFQQLIREIGLDLKLELIDEAYSTLEARELYFELFPPRGLRNWIPRTLQTPARPVDDLVAIVLLRRHLGEMPEISK